MIICGTVGFEQLLKVTVLSIKGGKVVLVFEIDGDIPVHRLEILQRICAEKATLSGTQ